MAGAATRRATQRQSPATPGNAEFVRACDLPEATHTPMAWPVAPCFLPACRLPGEASPRACAKAQAAGLCRARRVGRTAAAGHLQGWALGPACPSPAAVYSDLKKTIPLTT